jgi:hypothetical protein
MPTKEQMESVSKRIEELQEATYHCPDDGFPRPSPGQETKGHHREVMSSPTSWDTWSGLSRGELTNVLETLVDWSGFTEAQRADVIQRVLDGEEMDFWMDGVEQSASQEKWIADFHARVEELKRDGVPDFPPLGNTLPWSQATEERKLQNIVWESMSVWPGPEDTRPIQDEATLAVIEQNVDYSKLPDDLRDSLSNLRGRENIGGELQRLAGFEYDDYGDMPDSRNDNRPVRPLTEQLIAAVLLDIWPGNAAIIDFGIDSDRHLGALQFAIKFGEVTPEELDLAMGDGAKLTEIVQRGDNPYRDVTFRTSWDKLSPEPREAARQAKESLLAKLDAAARDRGGPDRAPTPSVTTLRSKLEKALFGDKRPEVKQEEKTRETVKENGRER